MQRMDDAIRQRRGMAEEDVLCAARCKLIVYSTGAATCAPVSTVPMSCIGAVETARYVELKYWTWSAPIPILEHVHKLCLIVI